jgi:Tfp pilus assembly protein PilF
LGTASRGLRLAAAAAGIALLALAGIRTASRNAAWRSQEEFFARLQRDAPRTYRAHFVSARYYYGEKRFPEAERAARRALVLYSLDPQVHDQLGQVLRVEGRCGEALPVFAEGVRLAPEGTTLRSRLIECALAVGDTARARESASEAVRTGQTEFRSTLERLSKAPSQRTP